MASPRYLERQIVEDSGLPTVDSNVFDLDDFLHMNVYRSRRLTPWHSAAHGFLIVIAERRVEVQGRLFVRYAITLRRVVVPD